MKFYSFQIKRKKKDVVLLFIRPDLAGLFSLKTDFYHSKKEKKDSFQFSNLHPSNAYIDSYLYGF